MSRFNEHGLTPQQEAFVQKVVSGETLSDAYRASYQNKMTAKQIHEESSKMASHPKVSQRLRSLQSASSEEAVLRGADVLKEVKRLAFSTIKGFFTEDGSLKKPHELDDGTAACVASFEVAPDGTVKYKIWDKGSALEKAMKHLGLYEKDNDQQANPLRELLDSLGGAVIGVSSGKARKK